MKIFLVQSEIDLGYHTVSAWMTEQKALHEVSQLNLLWQTSFPEQNPEKYFVEAIEVQE